MWTKRKAIRAAQEAIDTYKTQAADFKREKWEIQNDISGFRREYQDELKVLALLILNDSVDPVQVARVSEYWNCLSLSPKLTELSELRSSKNAERRELSSHSFVVNRESLLDPSTGSLCVAAAVADANLQQAEQNIEKYTQEAFQWLYLKKVHLPKSDSSFRKFWKFVSMETRKQKRYEEEIEQQFGRPYKSLVTEYEVLVSALKVATEKQKLASEELTGATQLLAHYEELCRWDSHFDELALEHLVTLLAEKLDQLEFDTLMKKVSDEQAKHVGKLHALSKKIEYAESLVAYMAREERDRLHRASSIGRVQSKWRRNPSGFVRGDKSKWLQDIPKMKRDGTRKRLGWSSSMRSNLRSYDRYDDYHYFYFSCYQSDSHFLAYDLFNHRPIDRMPYEGFSSSVIDEIGEFRAEEGGKEWIDGVSIEEDFDSEEELNEADFSDEEGESIVEDLAAIEAAEAVAETMEIEATESEDFDDMS